MKIISQANGSGTGKGAVCVAIGMFDGVHLGHQHILQTMVTEARRSTSVSVALTFDRHPNAVVAPERTPPLIYPLDQRLRQIAALGVETTLLIHFDQAFSQKSGEQFVAELAEGFGRVTSICIGSDFSFGRKRSGNVTMLRSLSTRYGFQVQDLTPVCWEDKVVSSTRIREAIELGRLEEASAMLGRRYSIAAKVMRGEQIGQKLGFPTANLDIDGLVVPPSGVYVGHAFVDERVYRAVTNLGYRPTLGQPQPVRRLEVHLLDFAGDLYGLEVEFVFGAKLRGEQRFSSLGALQEQIRLDIIEATSLLRTAEAPVRSS